MEQRSKRRQRDYVSYKTSCSKADEEFKQYDNLRELSIEQLQKYYATLNKQYVYTKKCYEGREEFKLKHVPEDKRDDAHDITISIYRRKANELTGIMARVSRQIERKLQELEALQALKETAIEVKEPQFEIDEVKTKPKKSKGRKKSKSKQINTEEDLEKYLESVIISDPVDAKDDALIQYQEAIMEARERLYVIAGLSPDMEDDIGPLQIYTQLKEYKLLSSMSASDIRQMPMLEESVISDSIRLYNAVRNTDAPAITVSCSDSGLSIYTSWSRIYDTMPIIDLVSNEGTPRRYPYQIYITNETVDAVEIECPLSEMTQEILRGACEDMVSIFNKRFVREARMTGNKGEEYVRVNEILQLYYTTRQGLTAKQAEIRLNKIEKTYEANKENYHKPNIFA